MGGAVALRTNELAPRITNERRASMSRGRGGCTPRVGVTLAARALAVKRAGGRLATAGASRLRRPSPRGFRAAAVLSKS